MLAAAPQCSKTSWWALCSLGLLWLGLSANLALAVARFQPNVLAWDQWDFLTPLFNGRNAWDLFTYQHGPHRQGLGFVVTSWILHASSWDARWDSLWIVSLLSLSTALALRLKWKLAGSLDGWDAWIPLVGLSLAQYESILFTPNASHSAFPLALTLALANAWLSQRAALRYLGAGVGAVALAFTGFGLFAGAVLTALLTAATVHEIRTGRRKKALLAAGAFAFAVLGWVSFAHDYAFSPAVSDFRFPWTPVTDYFHFAVLMLAGPWGLPGPLAIRYGSGLLLAVATVAAVASAFRARMGGASPGRPAEVSLLLLGAGTLFVCNAAIGRVSQGIEGGIASRYATLLFSLWLGIYLVAATTGIAAARRMVALTFCALALMPYAALRSRPLAWWPGTLGATAGDLASFEQFTRKKAEWVDTYLRTRSWEKAQDAAGDVVYPFPSATHMDDKLEYLRSHRLSFFASLDAYPKNFLPWSMNERSLWDGRPAWQAAHLLSGSRETLTFVTARKGFAEFECVSLQSDALPLVLVLEWGNRPHACKIVRFPAIIAVPVAPGFNRVAVSPVARAGQGPTPGLKLSPARWVPSPSSSSVVVE